MAIKNSMFSFILAVISILIAHTNAGISTKEGKCPRPLGSRRSCGLDKETDRCFYDTDCLEEQKCCENACGVLVCRDLILPPPTCNIAVDLGLLVDASTSITPNNFKKMKTFLKDLVSEFDVREGGTHVAAIAFGDEARVVFDFNNLQGDDLTLKNVTQKIGELPQLSGSNRMDLALAKANTDMFSLNAGTRQNAPRILLILTDGIQSSDSLESLTQASDNLKKNNVQVFVVAFGDSVQLNDLKEISSGPKQTFHLKHVNKLRTVFKDIALRSCKACTDAVDIGFAIPSNSFAEFEDLRDFVKKTLDYVVLGTKNVQIGLIVYNNDAEVMIKFDQEYDLQELKILMNGISYITGDSRNRLDILLQTAANDLFALRGGVRQGVAKKLIVVGVESKFGNQEDIDAAVQQLKSLGVDILGVAYGPVVDKSTMQKISSFPVGENYKIAPTITDLLSRVPRSVVESSCKAKKGKCPYTQIPRHCSANSFQECQVDHDCTVDMKCCQDGCYRRCKAPTQGCSKAFEIAFLMDTSYSVSDEELHRMKDFMKEIASAFSISETGARFSLVTYDVSAKIRLRFNDNYNAKQIINEISKLDKTSNLERRLDFGLKLVETDVFSLKSGIRQGVPLVLIALSGGPPSSTLEKLKEISASLQKNVNIWTVGSGPSVPTGYLKEIASKNEQSHKSTFFENLFPLVSEITGKMCSDKPGRCPRPIERFFCLVRNDDCLRDYECPGFSKCCFDGCHRTCSSTSWECQKPLDLAIVMESSKNIGQKDFRLVKMFAKDLVKALNIDNSQTEIAFLTFGRVVNVHVEFKSFKDALNKEDNVIRAIDRVLFTGGSNRAAHEALGRAHTELFTSRGGSRKNAVKGLIFITDGFLKGDNGNIYRAAMALKTAGVAIYPVAASRHPNLAALEKIASHSSKEHVFLATSLPAIIQYVHQISQEACKAEAPPQEIKLLKGPPGDPGNPGIKGKRGLPGGPGTLGSGGLYGVSGIIGSSGEPGRSGPRGSQGRRGPPGAVYIRMSGRRPNGQAHSVLLAPSRNPGQGGTRGPAGAPGVRGIPGPRGPEGEQGESGIPGQPGKRGESGRPERAGDGGASGKPGGPGPEGTKGTAGDTGQPGKPSPKGQNGGKGTAGPTGIHGERGESGPAGLLGKRGKSGDKGMPGIPGINGKNGPLGTIGKRGQKGFKGDYGRKGPVGDRGPTGVLGKRGIRGPSGSPGPLGPRGLQGETGSAGHGGFNGVPGADGKKGATGRRGAKGSVGDPGSTGVTGVSGTTSRKGLLGSPGPPGSKGKRGKDGKDGPQGPVGVKGTLGELGQPGTYGVKGPKGKRGLQGDSGLSGPQGAEGERGIQGSQGFVGVDGVTGDKGQPGHRGKTGTRGRKGSRGRFGKVGITGKQGRRGRKGRKGRSGNDGKEGLMGAPGDNGNMGTTGIKGSKGYMGVKGQIGLKGSPGSQGLAGSPGPLGGHGLKGSKGNTGEQGLPGFLGSAGEQGQRGAVGEDGMSGPQGQPGIAGNRGALGTMGDQGVTGDTGTEGLKGEEGPAGDQGLAGETGKPGLDGAPGLPGDRGPLGMFGPQGLAGFSGSAGQSGVAGTVGSVGMPGLPGKRGKTGDAGIQGTGGLSGDDGDVGVDGLPGPPGSSGDDGEKGDEGILGILGEPGKPGAPGSKGNAGDPGPAGTAGITGPPGSYGGTGETGPPGTKGEPGIPGGGGLRGHEGDLGEPGPAGHPGTRGERGLMGAAGSRGLMGPPGFRGRTGIRGDYGIEGGLGSGGEKGAKGDQGEIGERGFDGAKGYAGEIGDDGELGDSGLEGNNGFPGPPGFSGPFGLPGDTGFIGYAGITGEQGQMGLPGVNGKPGKVGISGIPGVKGDQGRAGGHGETGDRGPTGPPGPQGINGQKGFKGRQGDYGTIGDQGPPGVVGSIGYTGRQGEAGVTGEKGAGGPDGVIGPPGLRGSRGRKGRAGNKGSYGSGGIKGTQGEPGPFGFEGSFGGRGSKGNRGKLGSDGDKGILGSKGPLGPRGDKGLVGPDGHLGQFGPAGELGEQGPKGRLGGRGSPGPPGLPGSGGPPGGGSWNTGSSPRSTSSNGQTPDYYHGEDEHKYEQNRVGASFEEMEMEFMTKLNRLNDEFATYKKPTGTKLFPALTCKNLFNDNPYFKSGEYWLDPDEGAAENAVLVSCDNRQKSSCIFPVVSKTKVKQWFLGGDGYMWFREDIDETFKFRYTVESTQLTFLQLLSNKVSQNITYHCIQSTAWQNENGDSTHSIKLLGDNDREYKSTTPRKHRPIVLRDDCKVKDKKQRTTVIEIVTEKTARLPIRDVAVYDIGEDGEQFGLELGPVCFS